VSETERPAHERQSPAQARATVGRLAAASGRTAAKNYQQVSALPTRQRLVQAAGLHLFNVCSILSTIFVSGSAGVPTQDVEGPSVGGS